MAPIRYVPRKFPSRRVRLLYESHRRFNDAQRNRIRDAFVERRLLMTQQDRLRQTARPAGHTVISVLEPQAEPTAPPVVIDVDAISEEDASTLASSQFVSHIFY